MMPIAFEYWFVEGAIIGAFELLLEKLLRTRILNLFKGMLCFSSNLLLVNVDNEPYLFELGVDRYKDDL